MHLEHVNLSVKDVEKSAAFYCDLLGLHIRWKGELTGGRLAMHVGDDRSYLALFEATLAGRVVQDYSKTGINHFGFVVDDLDAARERLAKLGIEARDPDDYDPGRRLYFDDPDGIEVELVEYPT